MKFVVFDARKIIKCFVGKGLFFLIGFACVFPFRKKREREKFASSIAEERVGKKIGTINLGFSLQKYFSRSRLFLSRRMRFFSSSSSRASIYIFYFVLTYYCYYVLGFRA